MGVPASIAGVSVGSSGVIIIVGGVKSEGQEETGLGGGKSDGDAVGAFYMFSGDGEDREGINEKIIQELVQHFNNCKGEEEEPNEHREPDQKGNNPLCQSCQRDEEHSSENKEPKKDRPNNNDEPNNPTPKQPNNINIIQLLDQLEKYFVDNDIKLIKRENEKLVIEYNNPNSNNTLTAQQQEQIIGGLAILGTLTKEFGSIIQQQKKVVDEYREYLTKRQRKGDDSFLIRVKNEINNKIKILRDPDFKELEPAVRKRELEDLQKARDIYERFFDFKGN
ncbi:4580_t:CDS:2 [Scutellospora calospora]|uniref:4580_t:CDS:1 n=1 Tax=Scutellospora calospora TaxID=85575 RepID=A0ACA9JXW3_9GLOM|nr:4580_t:CDS:2 [Scutellospora calospora]